MANSNILFLGKIIPPNMIGEVKSKSVNTMQDAAIALQWHLLSGLSSNFSGSIMLGNILPVYSYPEYYNDLYIPGEYFTFDYGKGYNAGFCNITGVKQISKLHCLDNFVKQWVSETEGNKYIVSYTLDLSFLNATKVAKEMDSSIKAIAILADLPEFLNLSKEKRLLHDLYDKYAMAKLYSKLDLYDGYVLLTKYMAEKLQLDCPYIVMEGISTEFSNCKVYEIDKSKNLKYIFYAGTLHIKFGIINLIKAFRQITDPSYRLVICGVGEADPIIRSESIKDNRIIFKGQLPRDSVLSMMVASTVIVNPRQGTGEFTKYSFPSKNLEALSSGVPLIAYKLDGIPDEYDSYIHYVYEDGALALKNKIIEICELPELVRKNMGSLAKDFVLKNKSNISQGKRIVDFLLKLKYNGTMN